MGAVIEVRPAREADGDALTRIDLATWTSAVSPAPAPDPDSYHFFTPGSEPADVLVAEVAGVVAGWIRLGPPTPLASHAHVLQVRGLAVDPQHHGGGVGRRLVEAAIEESSRRGARKLTLRVLGSNVGARRLYERCGFRIEGVLQAEFRLDGRYVDDVLMARSLTT